MKPMVAGPESTSWDSLPHEPDEQAGPSQALGPKPRDPSQRAKTPTHAEGGELQWPRCECADPKATGGLPKDLQGPGRTGLGHGVVWLAPLWSLSIGRKKTF